MPSSIWPRPSSLSRC